MLKRILIAGWICYFIGVALLLLFPKHLISHWTLLTLLWLNLILIPTSVIYGILIAYKKRFKRNS